VTNTTNNCVKADCLELVHEWLCADPVVAQEHHSFFAVLVCDVYHFLSKLCNFSALECLEISEFLSWNSVWVVHVALINDVFRSELVANFFFKLLEDIWAYACRISVPVNILFTGKLVKNKCELMEECCISDNINIWMLFDKLAQTLHCKLVSLWLTNIESNLVLNALPVINNCVVH